MSVLDELLDGDTLDLSSFLLELGDHVIVGCDVALDILQNIGLFLLIALMVVANGNDLIKVFQGLMR